jgi:exonuclease SbcD
LLPYPSLGRVLTGNETASTPAELHRPIGESVANWIRSLPEMPGYDTNLRTILVAHLNVTGADVGRGLFRMAESADVIVDGLPTGFDYIALGHIHKPQCLRGLDHVRYSGSLDRMDFGEQDEEKGVVIVDIGPEGRRSISTIPIEPTPLITVTIRESTAAVEQIAAQPAPEHAVVKVVVEPAAAEAGSAVDLAIRDAMLNISTVEWQSPEPVEAPAALTMPVGSVRERVLDYVSQKSTDEHREALLALAAQFLDREGFS